MSKLHQASAERVQRALNIDGCEQIGLQSVTLRLTMKEEDSKADPGDTEKDIETATDFETATEKEKLKQKMNYDYFLIFDEYRNAYIWNRGLRTILHMTKIKQPITTVAFCCSSIDRINNEEIYEKMKINDNESEKWIYHISTKLNSVQKHIFRAHQFAQASCILVRSGTGSFHVLSIIRFVFINYNIYMIHQSMLHYCCKQRHC